MRLGWRIAWFIACLLGWCSEALAAPMLDAPALEYSQDGVNYQSFDAIVGRSKIGTYYDYHDKSGHPAFGTQRGTASVAVYFDDKHDALSLILISGTAGRGKGRATFEVSGLPGTTTLSISDDPREIKYKKGQGIARGKFSYSRGTDGLALSGLEQAASFAMRIALVSSWRVGTLRLVDGDVANGGQFINLDMSEPLFLREAAAAAPAGGHHHHHHGGVSDPNPVSGSDGNAPGKGGVSNPPSVPEPGCAMIMTIVGAWGLLRRRGRRG
jgi:hypothetical protein